MTAAFDRRPRIQFAIRRPAGAGRWWYEHLLIPDPGHSVFIPMAYPPATGDLISLWSREGKIDGGPTFRVVDRAWSHSGYGSADWPYGQAEPTSGPMLDIIVEPASGPYADETDICAEPTCEAKMIDGSWWTPAGAGEPDPHEHRPFVGGALA